jgi:hypothetical protein
LFVGIKSATRARWLFRMRNRWKSGVGLNHPSPTIADVSPQPESETPMTTSHVPTLAAIRCAMLDAACALSRGEMDVPRGKTVTALFKCLIESFRIEVRAEDAFPVGLTANERVVAERKQAIGSLAFALTSLAQVKREVRRVDLFADETEGA